MEELDFLEDIDIYSLLKLWENYYIQMNKRYLLTFGIVIIVIVLSALLFIRKKSEHTEDDNKAKILEQLMALPYLDFVKEDESSKEKRGVTFYDEQLSYQGLNLYNNHLALPSGAYLIDMRGEIWQRAR